MGTFLQIVINASELQSEYVPFMVRFYSDTYQVRTLNF